MKNILFIIIKEIKRLGIGDWGLGIGPQSPITNPQLLIIII